MSLESDAEKYREIIRKRKEYYSRPEVKKRHKEQSKKRYNKLLTAYYQVFGGKKVKA